EVQGKAPPEDHGEEHDRRHRPEDATHCPPADLARVPSRAVEPLAGVPLRRLTGLGRRQQETSLHPRPLPLPALPYRPSGPLAIGRAAAPGQIRPCTRANGSQSASRCQSYSVALARRSAVCCPASRATTASAMSIPAATPDEVQNFPSSTQRASRIHRTAGQVLSGHAK